MKQLIRKQFLGWGTGGSTGKPRDVAMISTRPTMRPQQTRMALGNFMPRPFHYGATREGKGPLIQRFTKAARGTSKDWRRDQ